MRANPPLCIRCTACLADAAVWALVIDCNGELRAVSNNERMGRATVEAPLCSTCVCTTVRYRDGREDPPSAGPLFDDAPTVATIIGGIFGRFAFEPRDQWGRSLDVHQNGRSVFLALPDGSYLPVP